MINENQYTENTYEAVAEFEDSSAVRGYNTADADDDRPSRLIILFDEQLLPAER